jgi:hypothetical protein
MASKLGVVPHFGGHVPNYKSSGEENLRADAHVYAGEATSAPSGKGTDAGGDATNHKVKSGGSKSASYGVSKAPKGVQTFSDEGV